MQFSHDPQRAINPLNVATRPVLEALESRMLLSVNLDAGTLGITGSEEADYIRVRPARDGQRIKVSFNDEISFFDKSQVTAINIDGAAGDDSIQILEIRNAIEVPATIFGGAGDDGIQGGGDDDLIVGGEGADTLMGGRGDDKVEGGAGNDKLLSSTGVDSLDGGDGDDLTVRTGNDDVIVASAGDDQVEVGLQPSFPIQTFTGIPGGYSVRQMRNAYGFGDLDDPRYKNRGKGQTIVIAIAFHSPLARHDLIAFAREQKTLPGVKNLKTYFKNNFKQVWTGGRDKNFEEGWTGEAMLDIQWAHAIAPEAKIVLVEGASNFAGDLFNAVNTGIDILSRSRRRGGVISMSFGFGLPAPEQVAFETLFSSERARNVSFIAASGDTGGVTVGIPNGIPSVTIVGGTKLYLDPYGNRVTGYINEAPLEDVNGGLTPPPPLIDNWNHDIDCFPPQDINDDTGIDEQTGISGGEGAWWNGSGGPTPIFNAPLWQQNRLNGTGLLVDLDGDGEPQRATPDLAWNGDPQTGVPVFNSMGAGGQSGWGTFGGTSAGAPQFAALVALANQVRSANNRGVIGGSLNERIYRLGGRGPDAYFNDIDVHGSGLVSFAAACDSPGTGRNDAAFVFPANIGWDYATGWGTPNARSLIPALADEKLKFTSGSKRVTFTGRTSQRLFELTGGGTPTGSDALNLTWFKGTTRIQGFNTLSMPSFRMHHLTSAGDGVGGTGGTGGGGGGQPNLGTVTIDVFGMDEQDGQPNVPAFTDPLPTGLMTAPGSPIFLSRNGNTITGKGFYLITVTTEGADPGDPDTQDFFYFAIEFRGTVNKNEIDGEFFAIDNDPHSTPIRGVFNEQGIPVVSGKFKT